MLIDKDSIMERDDISIEDHARLKGLLDIYELFLESFAMLEKTKNILDKDDPLNEAVMCSLNDVRYGLSRTEYDIERILVKYDNH